MFLYYMICLVITLVTIEILIGHGSHSSDQRLLPLLLGLIGVYNFYVIVEFITGETKVFSVLKYLLLVELISLIFYYVFDFLQIKFPFMVNMVLFAIIVVGNAFIIYDVYKNDSWNRYITKGLFVFILMMVMFCTIILAVSAWLINLNSLYKYLYFAFLAPVIGLIAVLVFEQPDNVWMPGTLAFFCLMINYLLVSGRFDDTSKRLKEDIFNKIDGIIFIFDSDFYFISATKKAFEVFSDELSGSHRHRSDYSYRNTLISWINDVEDVAESKTFAHKDNYYRASIDTVRYNGHIQGYIVSVFDITNETNNIKAANALVMARGEFLANMSHELRSPLHAIIGGTEIMLSSAAMSGNNMSLAQSIRTAGYNLLGIVNSILDYSKAENSMVELIENKYDLRQVLRQIFQNYVVLLDTEAVFFEIRIVDELPILLLGDEMRVRSIIQNLISNSIKFTQKGKIICEVSCHKEADEKVRIFLTVKDTGVGIDEDMKKKLFEKYEGQNLLGSESTGIGLYLVKYLVELMGGRISVESEVEEGTTFTADFVQKIAAEGRYSPCVLNVNTLYLEKRTTDSPVKPMYLYPEATALIVDDMKVNREILKGKLAPWRMKVKEAAGAEEAFEIISLQKPDIIFMDQIMPGMTGLEAAKLSVKKMQIPIVLVTANISEEMQAKANNEVSAFLGKPIDTTHLKAAIEDLLAEELREYPDCDFGEASTMGPQDKAYKKTLEAFVEALEELINEIQSLYENDIKTFEVKVHGIKGTARMLGNPALAMYSEIFEMAAQSEHWQFIERGLEQYVLELQFAVDEAKEEIRML